MGTNSRLPEAMPNAFALESADYWVRFTAHTTPASCVVVEQDERLVAVNPGSSKGVVRVGAGVYDVFLGSKFPLIGVVGVNIRKAGDWKAKVITVTDGFTAVNVLRVEVINGAAAADPDADVDLCFHCVFSKLKDR